MATTPAPSPLTKPLAAAGAMLIAVFGFFYFRDNFFTHYPVKVISAHILGLAADVAALGGVPIVGHQEPGGLTEKAVRALLLLPGEVEPSQIISLLGLGGASFPLADHYDHIHVGF